MWSQQAYNESEHGRAIRTAWAKSPNGKACSRRTYLKNHEQNKARQRAYGMERRAELRAMAMFEYGNKCACCGESTPEFLSIDHIEGGGNQHRKILGIHGGGKEFYAWLQREGYPKGYQVLCMNCNTAKGFFGRCPHLLRGEG